MSTDEQKQPLVSLTEEEEFALAAIPATLSPEHEAHISLIVGHLVQERTLRQQAEREIAGAEKVLDLFGAPKTIRNPYEHHDDELNLAGRINILVDPHNEGIEVDWKPRAESAESQLATLQAEVAVMKEALIDRRSGRPQCRGCYAYLDGNDTRGHTSDCWAKDALSSDVADLFLSRLESAEKVARAARKLWVTPWFDAETYGKNAQEFDAALAEWGKMADG